MCWLLRVVAGCWLVVIGCCSLLLVDQLVNTSGALSEGCSKGCSDIPMFGGECEEYEDWQYKVRIFLELSVPPVRNIPHVFGELTPRFEKHWPQKAGRHVAK